MISSEPIIGAINGLALGAGLTCTFWFDFNLASTEAKFSMRFSKLGLTPELDSSWLLPKLIGLQRAKEMMLTGKIYNANEALDFGLIAKIYEPHNLVDEAIKMKDIVLYEKNYVGGEFTLGIIPTSSSIIPLFINKFIKKYPNVNLKIEELNSIALIKKVLSFLLFVL